MLTSQGKRNPLLFPKVLGVITLATVPEQFLLYTKALSLDLSNCTSRATGSNTAQDRP
jgi:hypothetical protein